MEEYVKCERCGHIHSCELFRVAHSHLILFCNDYVEFDPCDAGDTPERSAFRKEWFRQSEDEFGEYDFDGFEW